MTGSHPTNPDLRGPAPQEPRKPHPGAKAGSRTRRTAIVAALMAVLAAGTLSAVISTRAGAPHAPGRVTARRSCSTM